MPVYSPRTGTQINQTERGDIVEVLLKQRVEILAQEVKELQAEGGGGGGGTTDAYTKAESDEKFLTKTDAASNYQAKGNYVQIGDVNNAIDSAIEALDVSSTSTPGYVVRSIAQEDGKIVPVAEQVDTTPTASSTKLMTSGGVYAVVGDINSVLEEVL